ncbi:MAG: glycosyltransferase [Pseudomonadota bacterium]
MTAVQHVILTRFNLATPGRESAIRNQPGWLRGRFDLFRDWCLPSVAAQSTRDFRWIVLFDEETPGAFRDEIGALQADFPFDAYFTPLFPADGWRRCVAEVVAPTAPMLLTTRLDNDDALSVDHVARVQAAVGGPERRAWNVTNGLIRQGDGLWQVTHPKNAFFSLLEPWGPEAVTACAIPHMDLPDHVPVTQIGGPPGWLQVVHGGNVSNKVRGRRVGPDMGAAFGGIGLDGVRPPGWSERAVEAVMGPLRGLRDGVGRLR